MIIKRIIQRIYTKLNQKSTNKMIGKYISRERANGKVVDLQSVIGMSLKKKNKNPRNIANIFDVNTDNITSINIDGTSWGY